MKNKKIKVEINKVLNYNPKNFYNLFFKDKNSQIRRCTLDTLNESAIQEENLPNLQQIKQNLLDTLSILPAIELEMEEENLKLNNKEMLNIIKKINDILYFIFLYHYSEKFEENYDLTKDYLGE